MQARPQQQNGDGTNLTIPSVRTNASSSLPPLTSLVIWWFFPFLLKKGDIFQKWLGGEGAQVLQLLLAGIVGLILVALCHHCFQDCLHHFTLNYTQTWTRREARSRCLCVVTNTAFPAIHCGWLITQTCSFQNGSSWYSTCLGTPCPRSPGTPIAVKRASWKTKNFNTCHGVGCLRSISH